MRSTIRYALVGFLLGLGAPVGSLLWRFLSSSQGSLSATLLFEWRTATYYYVYMTVGTVTAFTLFGYVVGHLNKNLSDLSVTDGLTGLFNHRYLHEHLAIEIQRSDRYATPLTCMMIDIDDFKHVNDRYGHPFGDAVLRKTSHLIRQAVRQTDIVGRYGGEEFLIVMPQTDQQAAIPLADRLRKSVGESAFSSEGNSASITLSIGIATYPFPDHGVKGKSSLLSAADQALYKAKRTGKNRVEIWSP